MSQNELKELANDSVHPDNKRILERYKLNLEKYDELRAKVRDTFINIFNIYKKSIMKVEDNDPKGYLNESKVNKELESHLNARTTLDLLNSVNAMCLRMGSELTDTDYRFNEYRRLNAFTDINQKLEFDNK
jgi:hypothetical protein